jgi:hypothetical protein
MESSPGVTQPARRKPLKVPIIFAPIYIPLLFLAGALSIPWTYIQKSKQRRQERRFAEQMKKAGRLMQWQEFKQAEANGTGTAIGEYLSMKGPFRLWWTRDDIPATRARRVDGARIPSVLSVVSRTIHKSSIRSGSTGPRSRRRAKPIESTADE